LLYGELLLDLHLMLVCMLSKWLATSTFGIDLQFSCFCDF
jgi:hypothetical protein